ncbi:glycosyltransferase family 4 protein [Streptomyces sp. NPDC059002]|uniref:glycosyltransferase family 4 protein n=1 Tax=Streptomyces sp. NPDC059002 TaxID=3346690 RepID=UPI00368DB64C
MKIKFLLTWADVMGGTERAVFTQAAQLAAAGHDVEILSVFKTEEKPFFALDPRVPVRYLVDRSGGAQRPLSPTGLSAAECAALSGLPTEYDAPAWERRIFTRLSDLELGLLLPALDCDVLITTTPALTSAAVRLTGPDVLTVHHEHRMAGFPPLPSAPLLDALVTVNERSRIRLREELGDAAPLLATIPNSLPAARRPRSTLTGRTVAVAGRLVAEKRIDHAVRAFAKASPEHPEWVLRVFGDGPERAGLQALAEELGMADRVRFHGSSTDMPQEWAGADLAVLTSRAESFGLVILEALAAGVPVVSYDCPNGPSEIIRHGVDGHLVPDGDVDALAAVLGRLMGDRDALHALGEQAADGVARFSEGRVTARWEALFAELKAGRQDLARRRRRAERVACRSALGAEGAH